MLAKTLRRFADIADQSCLRRDKYEPCCLTCTSTYRTDVAVYLALVCWFFVGHKRSSRRPLNHMPEQERGARNANVFTAQLDQVGAGKSMAA